MIIFDMFSLLVAEEFPIQNDFGILSPYCQFIITKQLSALQTGDRKPS
jgi:hypothetical protein